MSCRLVHAIHNGKADPALRKRLGVNHIDRAGIHLAERGKEIVGNLRRFCAFPEAEDRIGTVGI